MYHRALAALIYKVFSSVNIPNMNDNSTASKEVQHENFRVEQLKKQKKKSLGLSALGLGVLCAVGTGLFELGWKTAGIFCIIAVLKVGLNLRKNLLDFDLKMALYKLECCERELTSIQSMTDHQQKETDELEKVLLAGIELNTPAGKFQEQVVYRYAVKEGHIYEYAGRASLTDEPSANVIIFNELLYKRTASENI